MIWPKVSIVITSYWPEAKKYLDLLIQSIANLEYPKEQLEVIVVGKKSYLPQYEIDGIPIKTVCPPDLDQFYTATGVNYGISQASPESEYFFYMNDDVILTKDCLKNMVFTCRGQPYVANALSPCDQGMGYIFLLGYQKDGDFHPLMERFYKYDQLISQFNHLINAKSLYPSGVVFQNNLCIYATLIPRSIWEDVGGFDENFRIGADDTDWCIRASQKGTRFVSVTDSIVWHFGGSSHKLDDATRKHNQVYFYKKWGIPFPGMRVEDCIE